MPRPAVRCLAAAAAVAGVGLAGCGGGPEPAAAPRRPPALDRPITFTTEVRPLPDQEPLPATATVPTSPAPSTAATTAATAATAVTAATPGTPGAPGTAAARPAGRTACRVVAHIGDSTSVGMTSPAVVPDARRRLDAQYARVGAASRIEASGGRSIVERLPNQQNGFEVATRLRAGGYSGCWVIALGTCDAANVAKGSGVSRVQRIERMMSVIGTDPVLWVDAGTLVADGVWANRHMQAWNADLTAALARHPNARVFGVTALTRPGWFASDGIHHTSAGSTARAALVADGLAAAFPA